MVFMSTIIDGRTYYPGAMQEEHGEERTEYTGENPDCTGNCRAADTGNAFGTD